MFNSNNSMSPADYAALSNSNSNDFGSGGWLWWIIIIFMLAGWGNGFGNNSGSAENYTLASDFATLQRQIDSTSTTTQNAVTTNADALQRQVTSIANGISSLGYDQLSQMNGINNNISAATTTLSAQMNANEANRQQCCCNTNNLITTSFADLNYNLAQQSCQTRQAVADAKSDIISNNDANTRSILDFLTQDKIATLTAENQALKFAASQQAQNAYLVSALAPNYGCSCNG